MRCKFGMQTISVLFFACHLHAHCLQCYDSNDHPRRGEIGVILRCIDRYSIAPGLLVPLGHCQSHYWLRPTFSSHEDQMISCCLLNRHFPTLKNLSYFSVSRTQTFPLRYSHEVHEIRKNIALTFRLTCWFTKADLKGRNSYFYQILCLTEQLKTPYI